MRHIAFLLVLWALPSLAAAQVVSERPDSVAIVVYPGGQITPYANLYTGLVMVAERREVSLPAGPVRISFRGVAEGIVAQTVAVQGLPETVREQNFDYQLLTPGALLQNSEGRTISLTRTNPGNGQVTESRARVVSSSQGVLLDIDGRIEALSCSALPEKVAFDDLPPGYSDKPTLSIDTVSPRAGKVSIILSYLATGVSWRANYVARLQPDGKTLDLSSWITIGNRSATTFANAPVQVLAGRLERRPGETRPIEGRRIPLAPNCWQINSGRYIPEEITVVEALMARGLAPPPPPPPPPPRPAAVAAPPPEAAREDLGDYKLYTLPERTTLAAYQTKQLFMFQRSSVAYDLVHRRALSTPGFASNPGKYETGPEPAAIVAELDNKPEEGLGLPLPAGDVAIFDKQGGRNLLLGEARIADTAEGLPFELQLGRSATVHSATRVLSEGTRGEVFTAEVEVTLTNASDRPVIAQVREAGGWRELKVASESHASSPKFGGFEWNVPVSAGDSVALTYTLSWRP